jgi:epoxyqueuosine reductase
MTLAEQIKAKATEIGFDLVGIASAEPSKFTGYFQKWLDAGRAGSMRWLADRFDERTNPAIYFPGARSVIAVASNYRVHLEEPPSADHGKIARYALGDDYHKLMKDRLHDLADWLRETVPGTRTRSSVDTAPVMEKELAARAGIGWMGKNTCIINEKIGSFILLGQVLTTLDLPADEAVDDRCGSCTRCLDACPTAAITSEYQMDASRCISYLTIEHREEIAPELQPKMGDWLYGCDICQEVCPWNRKSPETTDPGFSPRFSTGTLEWKRVMEWTEDDFKSQLKGSAMKRVKLPMLKRNAKIVGQNRAPGGGSETSARDFSLEVL